MKKRTINDKYQQNDKVLISVKNEPHYDNDAIIGYTPVINIKVKGVFDQRLFEFKDDDAIQEFIDQLDITNPQQELEL